MTKVINCNKKTLSEFKSVYAYSHYLQKYVDDVQLGKTFPGDINKLMASCDKMSKLLYAIKITMKESK